MHRHFVTYLAIALVVVAIAGMVWYRSGSVGRLFKRDVAAGFRSDAAGTSAVTEEDLSPLPDPVRTYLRNAGVVGKPRVHNFRLTWEGQFKVSAKQNWIQIQADQYNFLGDMRRVFYIRGRMFGLPVIGRDLYADGKGNMLITIMGIVPVADYKGQEMGVSGLVTFFNDMCILAPATLIDPGIEWETVDRHTVRASIEDKGHKATATLYFNEQGELVDFVTEDRYYAPIGEVPRKIRWSTPVRGYRDFGVGRLPSVGEAIWHLEQGDFSYAKFSLKGVAYNCPSP